MQTFDVQGIEIQAPVKQVFDYVAQPANLPRWTNAFKRADARSARLATPAGEVEIGLITRADEAQGTVDWTLTFPDGSTALAQSRVTVTAAGTAIYSFVLHAPPVPLEQLEGALEEQKATLAEELRTLKRNLET